MEISVNVAQFGGPRPLAVVVGHERSGNHFLMNAIAEVCGYTVSPYLDLDHTDVNINFHHSETLADVLGALAAHCTASVIKSHHDAEFFAPIIGDVSDQARVFYIYRRPGPVMASFWRFIQGLPWPEGPSAKDAVTFAQAPPAGRLLRYQMAQAETMFARWAAHLRGWLALAETHTHVHLISYEDLRDDYENVMASVCGVLGCPGGPFLKPDRENYVKAPEAAMHVVNEEDWMLLESWIAQQMPTDLFAK